MNSKDAIFLSFAVSTIALAIYSYMKAEKIRALVAKVNTLVDERDSARSEAATQTTRAESAEADLATEKASNAELNDPALEAEVDAAIAR